MAIAPCFDPTTGASGGAAPGGGTAPGLTVTGRADGGGYTVTGGASRSLTISNPDGATLSTTVKLASDNSSVTVTGSTGTSPSWTAPAGGADGESVSVLVSATKDGLTTTVGFTERVVSTALASIALETIDLTDGTWTLDDPSSMVKTTTHAAGVNTITFNAKAASADFVMTSGSNFTGARYYKLLSISGSQATTATPLVFVADVEPDTSATNFNQKHYIGTTHNPTATVVNTIAGVGGGWQITSGSTTIQAGAWTRGATSFNSNATTERTFIASQRGFESLGAPAYMNIRSTDVVNNSNARASNQNAIGGAGANLYVAIFIGTSTGTSAIDDNDTAKFAAAFVATSYGGI